MNWSRHKATLIEQTDHGPISQPLDTYSVVPLYINSLVMWVGIGDVSKNDVYLFTHSTQYQGPALFMANGGTSVKDAEEALATAGYQVPK